MILFLLLTIVSILCQIFFPWWVASIATFIVSAFVANKSVTAFFAGFLSFGLSWVAYAVYIDVGNKSILSSRIATMMDFSHPVLLFIATFVLGALIGGFSALAGYHTKGLFRKRKQGYYQR